MKKQKTKNKTAKQTQVKSISVTQSHRYVTASTETHTVIKVSLSSLHRSEDSASFSSLPISANPLLSRKQ